MSSKQISQNLYIKNMHSFGFFGAGLPLHGASHWKYIWRAVHGAILIPGLSFRVC